MDLKRTSIFLNKKMHKTIRKLALEEGITMAEYIRRCVKKELVRTNNRNNGDE